MIFDIWKLVVKILPVTLMMGMVMFILGSIGDPKSIKNKKALKKWGLIIIGTCMAFIVLQMIVTYTLLMNS
jgi:hypothetical protein